MAVHFHPSYANLLAVGCYDGSVAVYDARQQGAAPLYHATVKNGKHNDAVWQVRASLAGLPGCCGPRGCCLHFHAEATASNEKPLLTLPAAPHPRNRTQTPHPRRHSNLPPPQVSWQEDELQRTLQFVSVSTDGDLTLWTLTKSELVPERLMRLVAAGGGCAAGDGAAAAGAAGVKGAAAGGGAEDCGGGAAGGDGAAGGRRVVGGVCMDFHWVRAAAFGWLGFGCAPACLLRLRRFCCFSWGAVPPVGC